MNNIIKFPKEHQDKLKKQKIKDMVNTLIDNCEGDFVLIMKKEDIQNALEDDIQGKFLIATTNIQKMKHRNDEYFFKGFGDEYNRNYLKLGEE